MSNIFTLDSFREEVEREFAPFQITVDDKVLTLRNVLRLPKKDREQVYALLKDMGSDDDDVSGLGATQKTASLALQIFPLVADDKKVAAALVAQIEDDLALTLKVFSAWMKASQVGEAEGSES